MNFVLLSHVFGGGGGSYIQKMQKKVDRRQADFTVAAGSGTTEQVALLLHVCYRY